MADFYAAYATQVSDAIQALIATTQVLIEPGVDFVSCGSGLNEHFVPKSSLEKHLRKCHGERRSRPIYDSAFYYARYRNQSDAVSFENGISGSGDKAIATSETREHQEDKRAGVQSLVEAETIRKEENDESSRDGVIAAITRTAVNAESFYSQVQAWQRIPRAFATLNENERQLVAPSSLRRWLHAELSRPGVLPTGEMLDEELVDYVTGLLDHPDFCHPDLLIEELNEFLGSNVANIVLALWKFVVLEIGRQSVFKLDKVAKNMTIQVHLPVNNQKSKPEDGNFTNPPTQLQDAKAKRDCKHRRASYRGKVGTKTGLAAHRDMIQKHMIGLSLETDRELVLGGGFQTDQEEAKASLTALHSRPDVQNWRNFTDALEVRNRSRLQRQDQSRVKDRSSSTSRSRERSRKSGKRSYNNGKSAQRPRFPSPERSKKRSFESFRRKRKSRSRNRSRSSEYRSNRDARGRYNDRTSTRDRDECRPSYRRGGYYRE